MKSKKTIKPVKIVPAQPAYLQGVPEVDRADLFESIKRRRQGEGRLKLMAPPVEEVEQDVPYEVDFLK